MRFESPLFLLLLLLIPFWWWWVVRRQRPQVVQFSEVAQFANFATTSWWTHPYILPTLRALVLVLLILTVARPQTGRSFTEVTTEGVDIVLAIDTSGSMRALDLRWNLDRATRLDVVKEVLEEFIGNRTKDRIGIVVFGEEAFTQAPLTLDHELLVNFVDQTFIGMAGDATAIGSAIAIGTKRLKDLDAKSKVLILLTDGESNAGQITPLEAAEAAKELGIKIYTVGVGTRGRAPIQVPGYGLAQIQASLDEDLLKQVASLTNGQYFRATDTESLQEIYQTIDELEKTEAKVKEYHEYEEHFFWFLISAMALFLFEFLLSHTRLRRLP